MALLTCTLKLYNLNENISPCADRKEGTLKVDLMFCFF